MPLRLIQVITPEDRVEDLDEILRDADPPSLYHIKLSDDYRLTSMLTHAHVLETLTDKLNEVFGSCEGFRILLLPVEGTVPKLEEPEEECKPSDEQSRPWSPRFGRVSREELEEDIGASAKADPIYMIMVALSAIVASVGLLKDSPAIVIGAMVIAPLLGPNVALALGTTLGDFKMIRSAAKTNLIGLGIAVAIATVIGLLGFGAEPTHQIQMRMTADLGDLLVGLASGAAGALAFTSGAPAAIVGVMVAVALLPPTAAFGILMGQGSWSGAGAALTLAVVNIVCINLSATGIFLLQGIRPNNWNDKNAKSATIRALVMWSVALIALGTLTYFAWNK